MEALKMDTPMNSWNDDRLDELNRRVDEGFKEMREGFVRVDREMKEGFARADREMKAGFARVDREMKEGFARVDREMKVGFERADARFATKEEMNRRFDEVDRKFEEVIFQLHRVNDRLDGYARVAFVAGVGLFGAVVIGILSLILQA